MVVNRVPPETIVTAALAAVSVFVLLIALALVIGPWVASAIALGTGVALGLHRG